MKTPKIIIVEDHDIFRDGLVSLLTMKKIANVIGEAKHGKEFLELIDDKKPDLVLMDISMPVMDGIEATREAINKYPNLNILVLSMYGDEKYYTKMINAGAKGFILKSSGKNELIEAINSVSKGNNYFSNDLLRKIIVKFEKNRDDETKETINLTSREVEILQLLCNGYTAQEIADKLFLSKKTIEGHRTNLFNKTKTKNSVALVIHAIKNELVKF